VLSEPLWRLSLRASVASTKCGLMSGNAVTRHPRSAAILVAVGLLLWNSAAPAARRQAAVPTPADVLGFTPGDDYKLADFSQIKDYFEKLDAASDRVTVSSAGKSTEGRDMLVAVISSEARIRIS